MSPRRSGNKKVQASLNELFDKGVNKSIPGKAFLELQQPTTSEGSHRSLAGAVDAEGRESLDAGDGPVQEDGTVVAASLLIPIF
jgi:hypothetical protein